MLLNQEGLLHKGPEFCQALKFVLKLQISSLLQQLAESGEESVVLTANVLDGTADHLGSNRGTGFLEGHEQLENQFLSYCAETRRLSVDEESDNLPPRSSFTDNNLLSPTLVTGVSPYHRTDHARSRYERESSTSDSVFSPDRRKSSASSKSLDEDMAMLTSQDYSDTPRSLSDSSSTWAPDTSGTSGSSSLETGERTGVSGLRYGISRSPTSKTTELAERMKSTSKSPICDHMSENIKHITLSSPSEFQYRKYYHQHTGSYQTSNGGSLEPQRLPPMFEFSKPSQYPVPSGSSSSESASASQNVKSNSGNVTTSTNVEEEMSESSPVNLVHSSSGKSFYSGETGPVVSNAGESLFSPHIMYKFSSSYSASDSRQAPSSESYAQSYESEGGDNKFKLETTEEGIEETQTLTETYIGAESREYHSELGEIYRLPKKLESKLYKQSSSVRKQTKSSSERQTSDNLTVHGYEGGSLSPGQGQMKDKDQSGNEAMKSPDQISQSNITKSFEEAVKIQQSIFQSSLGLFSPLQRQFLQPTRPCPQRERSQSLSDFQALNSPDIVSHTGRTRFPSSSFVENLESALVIDDDSKSEVELREGLDLSNKKRKMSVDDIYPFLSEDQGEASGSSLSTGQGDDAEYDRLMASQGGATGGRDDPSSSTKKYGKGNFIKVATGYQCRICCRVIRHMNNTTAHMRIHANVKPYKCQVCNQQFKYEVDRRYHFSKNHVDLFSKMYFPDEKKNS